MMIICYDLRRDKRSFSEEYGTLDIKMNFKTPLAVTTKLVIYTIDVNRFFVIDENGNFIPKMDKMTM